MTAALSILAKNWLGILIGIALAALVSFIWLIPSAREEGRSLERAAALQKSMELIQERGKTNEAVRNLSPADICGELGGVFADGKCQ